MGWWYPPVVAHDTRACYPRKPAPAPPASRPRSQHIVRVRGIFRRHLPALRAKSYLPCARLPNITTPESG